MQVEDETDLCFPQLLNISCKKPLPLDFEIVFLLYSTSLIIVALNLLVIISVSHFRQLHTPTNVLLLSLAVSDLLVGLVMIPGVILQKNSCWFFGDLICSLYNYLYVIISSASVGVMVLISVDRYVAICDPLHYSSRITVNRVILCVCLAWFGCFCYSFIFLKDELSQRSRHRSCYGECLNVIDFIEGTIDLVLNFFVPITVIIGLSVKVFAVAVSQARAIRSHVTVVTLKLSVAPKANKSELKAARTLGVLVVVFLICFCPLYCAILVSEYMAKPSFALFALYLFYFNSFLNPVVYALFYSWYRKAVKLVVTLQILQPGSREAYVL